MRISTPVLPTRPTPTRDLALELSELAQAPSVPLALGLVREVLGMDVAYTCQIAGDDLTVREVDGDGGSFHVAEGLTRPAEHTYCPRMLRGRLPSVIADVRGEPRAASLPITQIADIGAFATVALRLSDGALYGTLCAASHRARPELGYRELHFLHVVARVVADQLELIELKRLVRPPDSEQHDLLDRTTDLRTDALDLLEDAAGERSLTRDSAVLVTHLQHVANDLGAAERTLLHLPGG